MSPFEGSPKSIFFREPDEKLALIRYHDLRATKDGPKVVTVERDTVKPQDVLLTGLKLMAARTSAGRVTTKRNSDGSVTVCTDEVFDRPEYWAWLRQQIVDRRKWVAQRVGIEQIGYLDDVKPPERRLSLASAKQTYLDFAGQVSAEERQRVTRSWDEFSNIVSVDNVADITHPVGEMYERHLDASDLSAKTRKHRISAIRTVLAYCIRRGRDAVACRAALDALSAIRVTGANPLDPNPIRPGDFWAIYTAAVKADDLTFATLMLLSLNCCLYASEVAATKWTDINLNRGEFATRRRKTTVPRIGVLWPETVAALRKLPQADGYDRLFRSARGPHSRQTIFTAWQRYDGDRATFGQIRDASFTTACRISLDQARLLAGHRLPGAADHYVLRQPKAVAEACQAIHEEFQVSKHIKTAQKKRSA